MIVQISSGIGSPVECELAVSKLFEALSEEYGDIEKVAEHKGRNEGCYTSVMFTTDQDFSGLEGSVQWKYPSVGEHIREFWTHVPNAKRFSDRDSRYKRKYISYGTSGIRGRYPDKGS